MVKRTESDVGRLASKTTCGKFLKPENHDKRESCRDSLTKCINKTQTGNRYKRFVNDGSICVLPHLPFAFSLTYRLEVFTGVRHETSVEAVSKPMSGCHLLTRSRALRST